MGEIFLNAYFSFEKSHHSQIPYEKDIPKNERTMCMMSFCMQKRYY